MRRLLPLALLIPFAAPALASDGCDDLWFTRNLVMDRAGYCFGSALGQAVFDNGDCTGKTVSLDAKDQKLVDRIRKLETRYECAVDTGRKQLDVKDLAIRRRLTDLPIAEEFPGGCLGWQAPETPLHAGRSPSSEVIGRITPGDFVGFFHIPAGDWQYVTAADPDWTVKSGGWLKGGIGDDDACRDWAG